MKLPQRLNLFVISLISILLFSCGMSELERYKIKESIDKARLTIEETKHVIISQKAELESAKDKMGSIKEWRFLRTDAERSQQIRNQSLVIQSIEKNISDNENYIERAEQSIGLLEKKLSE
jgi:hypothetical protein